ncbi:MAG TPA: hypothetical protein VIL74_13530 [Pyrinomonadaceae bacterium]|jgi:hypothetical protein
MSVKLQQAVTQGSLPNTNFFNGRLVTGADLTREQTARRESVSRLGETIGEGIAEGLRVKIVSPAETNPLVAVSPGRALNRCGQALGLYEETIVDLAERIGSVERESIGFSRCPAAAATGTYAAGFGLYLLVLSPVMTKQGSAPVGGLKNSFAACGSDVILEAVQFRLLPVDPFLANDSLPGSDHLRNYLAYRCFGVDRTQRLFEDPYGFALENYGLLDEMRGKTLSDNDVPLALVSWTANGLEFVEMWAVRRRVAKRSDAAGWTQLIGDRRASETEAMIEQFADHIAGEAPDENDFREVRAVDHFFFLPPIGILPLAAGGKNGFDLDSFFGEKMLADVALLDGDSLRPLLREAATHEPISLRTDEKIRIYLVRENFLAAQAGQVKQIAAVFAKRNLPYYGTARFDLADWDSSRFA